MENILSPPRYLAGSSHIGANLVFSPNDQYLAIGASQGLSIINLENKETVLKLHRMATDIPTDFKWTSFNSDSSHIMAFSDWWTTQYEMSIWELDSAERVRTALARRGRRWTYLTWLSPDWRYLARRWHHFEEGTIVNAFDIERGPGAVLARLPGNIGSATFSPDGALFVVAVEGLTADRVALHVYDTATWSLLKRIETNAGSCEADVTWRFSHDNTYLAFAYTCMSTKLSVWHLDTEELVFHSETDFVGARFTSNNKYLVSSGRSGISVWNIKRKFEHSEYPGSVPRLHPNNELMVAIGPDDRVWIWNIESKKLLVMLPIPLA